ncbi:hypothetical protein BC938DRAFT_481608 [Jimgerdemannia flammicorona]|uniref:PSI domain-containing protein n=1 Tax=Jimgerdemannia flammicorona TaxID=994334 RepID=A0A433QWS5_9FUNG|nr:hypothetical protein BC938DRAFT_481608 [Jimgerdemannia flammicorona]
MLSHQGIWSRSNTSLLIVMLQYVWWSCMMSLPALGAAVLEDLSFANSPLALLELYSTPLSNSISDSCGVYTNCGSCVAVDSCGFCVKANKCVAGGVWGPAEKDSCGEGAKFDFLYQQCQVTHKYLLYGLAIVISLATFGGLAIIMYCCCRGQDPERQRLLQSRPYVRRSATYYQWNRPPPSDNRRRSFHTPWQPVSPISPVIHIPSRNVGSTDGMSNRRFGASPNLSFGSSGGSLLLGSGSGRLMGGGGASSDREEDILDPTRWVQRRNELLKKYERSVGDSI